MTKKSTNIIVHPDGTLDVVGLFPEKTPEELAERKKRITQLGHVKRRLKRDEPLNGSLLRLALEVVRDDDLARKLEAGQPLSEYEKHLMFDMYLLHARLGA